MSEVVAAVLVILGSLFALVSAVGMLRLPDTLIRMHAATKAGTLGAGLILAAVAMGYGAVGMTLRALMTMAFLLLTAPVAAHLIGRAAYRAGVKLSPRTWVDQLKDQPIPTSDEGIDKPTGRIEGA